jgi:pyruvate kinase
VFKTKIISTLGPACSDAATLRKMMLCGMDVARLNMSHGKPPEQISKINLLRKLNKTYRRHIKILIDLEGPRIRVGTLKNRKPIELLKGQLVWVTNHTIPADKTVIPIDYEGNLAPVRTGQNIFIDDGLIHLKAVKTSKMKVLAKVMIGGMLKERKGVNIPDAKLEFKGLSAKDRCDIAFAIDQKADFIAQSFVRNKEDIQEVADIVRKKTGGRAVCKLIAKIENREGIKNIDEILSACDGIMVARGDLGISVPIFEVPILQKMLIKKCNKNRKLAITATQMLESMVENISPTRAEVSDVANAILDGTDYVMLSAETAVGKHPVEAVDMMNKIIAFTETSSKN